MKRISGIDNELRCSDGAVSLLFRVWKDHLYILQSVPRVGTEAHISSLGGSPLNTTLVFDWKQPCSGASFSGNHPRGLRVLRVDANQAGVSPSVLHVLPLFSRSQPTPNLHPKYPHPRRRKVVDGLQPLVRSRFRYAVRFLNPPLCSCLVWVRSELQASGGSLRTNPIWRRRVFIHDSSP